MRMLLFSHYVHFGRSVWSVIGSHVTLTGPLRLQEEFISVGRLDTVTYPRAPHLRLSPSLNLLPTGKETNQEAGLCCPSVRPVSS